MIAISRKFLALAAGAPVAAAVGGFFIMGASAQPVSAPGPAVRTRIDVNGLAVTASPLAERVKMTPQSSVALLKRAEKLGPHAGAAPIRLTVGLRLRNASGLEQFLRDVQNPHSPVYRHFLTPAEFTAQYGPSAADVAAVTSFLKRHGIRVADVSANRILIHTEATTEAYEHAFDVRINDYKLNGREFFSTEDRPSLPASVAGAVANVIGLANAVRMRPMSHVKPLALRGDLARRTQTASTPAPPPQTSAYYNPLQIATAYDWPSITDSDNGTGVKIAILTASSSNLSADDYTGFWDAFGLPDHAVNIIPVDGDEGNTDGTEETLLDMEYGGAMGPGAALDVYIAADPSFVDFTDLYNQFAEDDNDQVMTTSWGAPEAVAPVATDEEIFMQAAAQGISMFAAAGDNGSGDNYDPKNMADYPSVSAWITAANGTELRATKDGDYISESAWVDTGGAISAIISEPDWQRGPGVPPNGWRNNSDMAMNAGPDWPYVLLYQGQWYAVWGTSAVAPQFAGMFAIGVSQNGNEALGQSNKLIYDDVNVPNYATDFRDVTTGNNGAYSAGPDWDHPTGWGSPKATSLLSHLGIQGPAGTLAGTVTDAASGMPIAKARVTLTPGNYHRSTGSDGKYAIRVPVGDYTATVTAFAYQAGTASVSITDGNTTTQDFALEAAPTATLSGQVSDGSGHGYPLYAEVRVTTPGFGQVADMWTNPVTGAYSVELPMGYEYTLTVTPYFDGYEPGVATLTLAGDTTQNFSETVGASCQAPGYAVTFGEDFNGGFPPAGWSVTNDAHGASVVWKTNGDWGDDNYTGGNGGAATADSNKSSWTGPFDTSLVSPVIDVSTLPNDPKLEFRLNFQHNVRSRTDALDVDISTDGGSWNNIAHFGANQGGFYALPGANESIDLAPYIPAGTSGIRIRWRYSDPRARGEDWYAQIDDVIIGACAPLDMGLVAGQVKDANTGDGILDATVTDDRGNDTRTFDNPADPNLPTGYYFLFSTLGNRTLTAAHPPYRSADANINVADGIVNAHDFPLDVGRLISDTDAFNVQVMVNSQVTKALTLDNTGDAPVNWKLHTLNLAPIEQSSRAPVEATAPGTVVASFAVGFPSYGLGVDRDANDLWIGSPAESGGDGRSHRFLFDGTNTGDTVATAILGVDYLADAAYDDRTGMLWQWGLHDTSPQSCIYELDPRGERWTERKICLPLSFQQRGLAYDPVTDSWYSGGPTSFSNLTLYRFDDQGRILDSIYVGLPIVGLAYNASTGHLFVLSLGGNTVDAKQVTVLDTRNEYERVNSFDIPGFPVGGESAGFGYDCNNDLWVSGGPEQKVFEIRSGETGWCSFKNIPWLAIAPPGGTIAAGAQAGVSLTFDGTGQSPFTTSQAELLLLGNTPYQPQTIPVTVTWEPQPVNLTIAGTASPSPIAKGKVLIYTLTVVNKAEANHGTATATELDYALPAGVSYVSGSGDGVTCTAPPAGTAQAPDAATVSPPGTVSCGLGSLAQGASRTVEIAVQANTAGTLTSTFTVSAREPDDDTGSNTLSIDTEVIGTADVGVSASDASIPEGGSGTLHLNVTNAGPDAATDVMLKIKAGGNVKLQGAIGDAGDCVPASGGNGYDCSLGEIASGASDDVALTVFGAYAGKAAVTAQATTSANDGDEDNNVATATVTITGNGPGGGGSGGGGGFGWLGLLALLALCFASMVYSSFSRKRESNKKNREHGPLLQSVMHRRWLIAPAAVVMLMLGMGPNASAAAQTSVSGSAAKVITAKKFMRTQPLRNMRWNLPPIMQRILEHHPGPLSSAYLKQLREKLIEDGSLHGARKPQAANRYAPSAPFNPINAKDPALQRVLAPRDNLPDAFTQPIIGFDGIGHTTGYDSPRGTVSPESNLAVGAKYVVQAVSSAFAVYDKSDGNLVLGPVSPNSLWADFGGHCADQPFYPQNIGGPIVTYDQLAERWIISRVSTVGAPPVHEPMLECVAVSETDDPTGAWYLYAFPIVADRTDYPFLTYPTWGLWRDSYLASWYLRVGSGTRKFGIVAAAFDRAELLKGDPNAQMVEFTVPYTGPNPFGYYVLPASLDGRTLPPAGAPGYFLGYSSPNMFGSGAPYALLLWRLSVDWSNPAAATLTGPTDIAVDPFTDFVCGYAKNCIPQKGTDPALDAVSYKLLYRLAYRNFGDHEAMVVDQTVGTTTSGKPPTGVRWYELDTSAPGANDWAVAQQGTFAPADGKSRWMGSVAMDGNGDMALGYSLSSPDIYPSIAYTGHKAGDPVNEMTEPETVLQAGGGFQRFINYSWGDYTDMAIDPFGDCDFWYTNEYYADTVSTFWSTHIGAFNFASCVPAPVGMLAGTVSDAATGDPLVHATLTLTGDIVTRTDGNGQYRIELAGGSYNVTASDFGYSPQTAAVSIGDDQTTTQDFQLTLAPKVSLSGKITDGSGHGYALYAHVKASSPGFGPVADAWTNPQTGEYSIQLPQGFDYIVTADAYFDGYREGSATLSLNDDTTQDFALAVDTDTCEAPGYSFAFGATFNGDAFPPAGWSIVNAAAGVPVTWAKNGVWLDDNYTGGSGNAAEASSNFYGQTGSFDTRLITPEIAVSSLPADPVLKFKLNYSHLATDALDVDISVDGGAWQTMDHIATDQGTYYDLPGTVASVSLADYIPAGAQDIRLRWRYYDLVQGWGWYAQIDDVSIGTCALVPGGLIEGQVSDANTGSGLLGTTVSDEQGAGTQTFANPDDPNLPLGYYFLFARSGNRTITAARPPYQDASAPVNVANGSLNPLNLQLDVGQITAAPAALSLHVPVNGQDTREVALANVGGAATGWRLRMFNVAPPLPATVTGPFAPSRPAEFSFGPAALSACDRKAGSNAWRKIPVCAAAKTNGPGTPLAPAAGTSPGSVVSSFATNIPNYALGVDRDFPDLWIGSPAYGGLDGDAKDHRFLFDGSETDGVIATAGLNVLYMADMAYDDRTGMLWQLGISAPDGTSSCIYELNPRGMTPTGRKICPPFPNSERGLAYDPVTNTWYAGNFQQYVIYHFDDQGRILDSRFVGLPIIGLAYNPATAHLFVLTSGGTLLNVKQIVVLDARHDYARLSQFDIEGLPVGAEAAGFGYDCANHLWVSDGPEQKVFEIESGETGWCALKHVAWLAASPASGTLAAGAGASATVTFDGTDAQEFTTSQAQIQIVGTNTPYALQTIPVTVSWDPQPVNLAIAGTASSDSINKGGNIVYTLTVANEAEADHGAATETTLTYPLPAGVSYVSGSGAGVSCTAAAGSSPAPAAATGQPPAGTVTCDLGTLAQGATKAVTIAVTANVAGKLTSTFNVSAREPDDDTGNNTLSLDTEVLGTADVGVSATGASVPVGNSGTVQLNVANAGPDTATDVTLKLSAGSNVKLNAASAEQGSCSVAGGGISCELGDVASGATVRVDVAVFGAYAGTATLTGQVTTTATDPDPDNDTAQATVTIAAGGGGGGGGTGGGGGFGWFALAALLALVLVGFRAGRREV